MSIHWNIPEEIQQLRQEVENRDRHIRQIEGEFMEQLRFVWKEYVLCDENELTEDAKALRAELLDCIKDSK